MAAANIYTLAIGGELNARAQEIKHRMDYQRLRKVGQLGRELEDEKSRASVTPERVKAA